MTLSLITLHYEQPDSLIQFLNSISHQTHPLEELIVVDDGSSCELSLPSWVRLIRRPRHPKNYPQWARCVNTGVEAAHGDGILLIWCNWTLESDFVFQADQALQEDSAVVWCAPVPGVPEKVVHPQNGDNRGNYVFRRARWVPWDERFDDLGGIHAVVVWIWQMMQQGMDIRYRSTLRGTHTMNASYRVPYERGGIELSWALCQAILDGNVRLAHMLYEENLA